MTEQTIYLDTGLEEILNLDTDDKGQFIAITNKNTILTNDDKLQIDASIKFPIIRKLNNDNFLVVDCRTDKINNGHIFDFTGKIKTSFLAGDGIEDIVIQHNKIIITYFDEGVLGYGGPNNDGVTVFDFAGNQLFGFNSSAIWGHILDCYCICKHGTNRVLFYAYTDLRLYELNLETLKVELFDTPNEFKGTTAISSKSDTIYFHSSYHDKYSFFSWNRNKSEVVKFGNYPSKLKGIKNGKFFTYGTNSFTIVDPTE
ncbi:MAG TPA: hypothetical protein VL443_26015 [Cyclobacteriaceae bacterium]|jgi:hypothetical protein|nr:hypothetical protein [Cyclobacteriaceae bacterium]